MADAEPGADFRERYAPLIEKLQIGHPRWIRDAGFLHLPAHVPPWTDTGIRLESGDRLTLLAAGRVNWWRDSTISVGPRYHLWGRIGNGEIFRLGSDIRSLTAREGGQLQLCIQHGVWASATGVLASSTEAYDSLSGGINVLVVRWGDAPPDQGLAALAALAPTDQLIGQECARVCSPRELPPGFEPPWFVGQSDIFYTALSDGAPAIALRADANAGIVRRPCRLALLPGTFLEWRWRVNTLPSRVREDVLCTHDYASIALEFDDGRDLTWYWSAELPEGHHYACPIPKWAARETHMVVRSGAEGLGSWLDERRDVHADASHVFGRMPSCIIGVWLIGVSIFQQSQASVDFRRIAMIQDGRTTMIFPGGVGPAVDDSGANFRSLHHAQ